MSNDRIFTDLLVKAKQELEKDGNYPESLEVIQNSLISDTDEPLLLESELEIAEKLHETDGALPMHEAVAEFVLAAYFDEYVKGNVDAACNLGSLYYTGRAGEQNYAKAVEYYTFAADNGSRQAAENLGYCYYYGRDVEIDYEKSFFYFLKGALDGHINSLYKIGDFYKNGYFVKKDEKQAFYIYERCADTMTDEALPHVGADVFMRLGECFYKGIGTEKDLRTALNLYQLSERLFYDRLQKGDFFISKILDKVIKEEEEIRQIIRHSMPDKTKKK